MSEAAPVLLVAPQLIPGVPDGLEYSASESSVAVHQKEDTVSCQTPAVRMVEIIQEHSPHNQSLKVNYDTSNVNIKKKNQLMPMESAISYIAASSENLISLKLPQTLADVDNIENIVDKCKDKEIRIFSLEASLTGKLLEITTKKCLEIERNTIVFSYTKEGCMSHDIMQIESKLNDFSCHIATDNFSLFPYVVQDLQAMKNQNMLIEVRMYDFEKLFLAMNWKYDTEMINSGKEKIFKSSFITMVNLHADDDNNKYKMIDDWIEDDSEDINSCMSEDRYSSLSELDGEISSEDEEPEPKKARLSEYATNVKPATVTSFYIDEKEKLVSRESFDGPKLRILDNPDSDDLLVYYSDIKQKGVSRNAAINHIKMSKKKLILVDPQSMTDLVHIDKIRKMFPDKAISILSFMGEDTGATRPILNLIVKRCLETKNNSIFLTYTKKNPENQIPEWLSIESELSNFSSEIFYEDFSLFPSLVKTLKSLKNQNMEIALKMESEHKKVFEAMKWNYDEDMADFFAKKSGFTNRTYFEDDDNSYVFCYSEYKNRDESSLDTQIAENAKPTEVNSFYVIEELQTALGSANSAVLVDTPAIADSGLLLKAYSDIFGRIRSEMSFPGLPAFYHPNTDTWWDGELGWTWNHSGVSSAPEAAEDFAEDDEDEDI